ncbi:MULTISPECIES: hypothetical protein [Methylobacterium]|uniref:hypothetical protein n=1 Tax=Methylobacterium TaxID=407 RepID=UPI0013EA6294|nr:hypothetical protein [Methylobacterium sp. DB0501]NGM34656.1 hypothetical protein [Methylobacterium sp. DB0501]
MPTDLRPPRPPSEVHGISTLRVAIIGIRLRLLGWRIEQALEEHDHVKLLQLLNTWADLHRRTSARLHGEVSSNIDAMRDMFCDRARKNISKIVREEQRLDRVASRMKRARIRENARDYERSYAVGKESYFRTLLLWRNISASLSSRR